MDTITHTFLGLAIYGAVDKRNFSKREKRALLFTAVAGSQIPDIDVVSQLWDSEGQYQMWHRGITHSVFMVPVFAAFLYGMARWFWKVKSWLFFWIGLLAVFIHNTIDLFNAWGTGYFEPFSSVRLTFGTLPIVDFVIWAVLLGSWLISRYSRRYLSHHVFRIAWLLLVVHVAAQTSQGYIIYNQYEEAYEERALSASFVPWHFSLIGKQDGLVSIYNASLFREDSLEYQLESAEEADLEVLFDVRPEARTLYEWAPFVVIVEEEERIGIYDPRFYRDGQSFLFEYIEAGES